MFIESVHNEIIKLILSLKEKKNRDELSLFIVEGEKQVNEIPKDWKIKFILITEKYQNNKFNTQKTYITTEKLFSKISSTKTPQGVLAVVEKKKYEIEKIILNKGLFVVLENIQDPGNIGTIIRTAEAYGCKGIFISKNSADIYNDKVVRATMGAMFNIAIVQECDIIETINLLKYNKIQVCAMALDSNNLISKFKFDNSVAIIVGNESQGISEQVLNVVDEKIKIDMFGKIQSLNAAVACSITIYEVSKQLYAGK